jgi:hypothetical protein
MKKVIVSSFFLLILSMTFAQSPKEKIATDPRIIEVFGQETVDFYLENKPSVIQYYNFFLENSYSIEEMPQEKMEGLQTLPELTLKNKFQTDLVDYTEKGLENLNIMKYELKIDSNIGPIYRLGNTNKIIIFLSGKEIQNLYNKYLLELK